ncbi:MAG: catalase family protein [Leptolyngbyaceae cyanobacterium MO_188.B28]|nr:catalase family protein [Leptolyngbyaceae cyanobacterium MO_188.B28]
MKNKTGQKELYKEYPLPDEAKEIEQMLELMTYFHLQQAKLLGRFRRGQHTKDTGCLKGEFRVESGLPEWVRVGVFQEPQTFDAIIRFSNGSFKIQSDRQGDGRGMAIKLLGVGGKQVLPPEDLANGSDSEQDFIMVNNPVFPFPDIRAYRHFFELRKWFGGQVGKFLFFLPRPRLRQIAQSALNAQVSNPLEIQYWSMSPYRLGNRAMKFSAKPTNQDRHPSPSPVNPGQDDFLFDALAERIKEGDVYFDFMVQCQTDPDKMPIEDVSIEWPEPASNVEVDLSQPNSKFIKVATVKIPQQDPYSDSLKKFREACENKIFSPWHAILAHQPLGGINRLRKVAYHESALRRRRQNTP